MGQKGKLALVGTMLVLTNFCSGFTNFALGKYLDNAMFDSFYCDLATEFFSPKIELAKDRDYEKPMKA